ncbi:MAG: hypothetical protein ACOYON_05050 [Fimbriimonas sp.]
MPTLNKSWTKVPNQILDQLLPKLKDTELRVLLVLIRSTNGWNRAGRAVILPYHQLKQRTGRGSEALARAISRLQTLGLIHTGRTVMQPTLAIRDMDTGKTVEQQNKERDEKEQRSPVTFPQTAKPASKATRQGGRAGYYSDLDAPPVAE